MKHILLVEDDKALAEGIVLVLRQNELSFQCCHNVKDAKKVLDKNSFDLILLDINLPDGSGLDICRGLRKEGRMDPVIFLTALDTELHEVTGFQAGADDYITKPFNAGELLARIRVALRHRSSAPRQEPVFELDTLKMDFEKRKVSVRGEEVHLTPIEYKMLSLLVNNSGKVLTHHYIQQEVWGYDTTDDYQSLRVFMANIRRKIEEDSTKPRFILTEVGVGYRFVES